MIKSKWEVILMDFIVGLSMTSRRHDSILVVVYTLIKSENFIPMKDTYQAWEIERYFENEIVKLQPEELNGSSISLSGNLHPTGSSSRDPPFLNFSEDRNSLLAIPNFWFYNPRYPRHRNSDAHV
jgi:hypothetical protein